MLKERNVYFLSHYLYSKTDYGSQTTQCSIDYEFS